MMKRKKRYSSSINRGFQSREAGCLIKPLAVAAIDVLGMRQLLRLKTLRQIARDIMMPFMELSGEAMDSIQLGSGSVTGMTERDIIKLGFRAIPRWWYAFVSDSLIIAWLPHFKDGKKIAAAESVELLGWMVARIIAFNSNRRLWLRGAISYGECLMLMNEQFILLGKPVIEAFSWEKRQEWIGAMLAPSAIRAILGCNRADYFKTSRCPPWFVEFKVPLKPGPEPLSKPLVAIDWTFVRALGRKYTIPRHTKSNSKHLDVVKKVTNTIRFCKTISRKRGMIWTLKRINIDNK